MTRDEQVQEMARDICEYFYEGRCYLDKKECDCKCSELKDAQYLYSKGYRKVKRGEWIAHPRTKRSPTRGRVTSYNVYCCSICERSNGKRKSPFCPHCGADMRGEKK